MSSERDVCQVAQCDRHSSLIYCGKGICREHWKAFCRAPADELKAILRIAPVLASTPPPS